MTYKRHWLLSWGGTLGNGADIWANNVRFMNDEFANEDSIDPSDMESHLDDFVGDIKELFAKPEAFISNSVECSWVKFNEIGPDGRYVDQATTHVRFLEGTTGDFARFKGVGSTPMNPTFVSICVTTTTGRQRGPGSRGRLFIPQPAIGYDASGRISSGQAQMIATAYGQFFTDLGDEAGIDTDALAPAVVSNVGDPGPQERITGVKVGNVPDVIRRRKSALVETYATATVSTS